LSPWPIALTVAPITVLRASLVQRIRKLEALGFEWSFKTRAIPSQSAPTEEQEAMWQESFQKLKAFKEENGHCDISEKEHPALSKWVGTQRTVYRRNQMTQQRKEALESLGFDFGAPPDALSQMMTPRIQQQEQIWNQRLDELKRFKQEFGHCNVRRNDLLGLTLRTRQYCLEFQNYFTSHLCSFLLQVPGSYARDPVLARWVGTQRTTYRRGQMPQDRINALEAIGKFHQDKRSTEWSLLRQLESCNCKLGGRTGFQWRVTDGTLSFSSNSANWHAMVEKLKTFKEKNGKTGWLPLQTHDEISKPNRTPVLLHRGLQCAGGL
jgi:Helicase associated domain